MSLDGTYDPQNIFGKILRQELPCFKLHEDDVSLSFMDLFPQTNGHTLVIPKVASRNFLDFPADALGTYMQSVQRVAQAVTKAMQPAGLRVLQFNGAPSGQTVFHLHFHLIPIYEGGAVGMHAAQRGDDETLKANAAKIAAALK